MHRLVTTSPKGGGYRVLDIRPAVEFEYAHLTKVTAASGRVNGWNFTVNVPLETAVDEAFLQDVRIACPEKSRGVVVVDANGSGNAHDVAEMLKADGYAATTVLHGGWAQWLAYFDSTGQMDVLRTFEVRWFIRGMVPKDVSAWFFTDYARVESRRDSYVQIRHTDTVNVKIRGGGGGPLQIKVQTREPAAYKFSTNIHGLVDGWEKLTVWRRLCGVDVELTNLAVGGLNEDRWWTLSFEAFGDDSPFSALMKVAQAVFSSSQIPTTVLTLQASDSYASWLSKYYFNNDDDGSHHRPLWKFSWCRWWCCCW
ncbi:Rhodanese domain-containing protein [Pycnococcus provasolii]